MNQSKSENIQASAMYLSIFYNQNLWHKLLPVVRETLMKENRVSEERRAYVFLSSHKGPSVRIAFDREGDDEEKIEEGIIKKLMEYVTENPSEAQPIHLPISGFFQDFPNNVIKYNLFNQRSFAEGGLSDFQLVISKLLLAFFDDHVVDEDALFTLIVNLNESILKGLCQNQSSKIELIQSLIWLLEIENEEYSLPKLDVEHFRSIQYLIGSSTEYDIDMLLLWVEKAANLLRLTMASDIGVYLSIQYIIKLHLFNSSNELFVDVLHYLENSLMYAE